MDINELQKRVADGGRSAEEELFSLLSARFRLFLRQRLKESAEIEEIVQEALKTIFEKYRQIEFETSFSGWAYRVLNNKLQTYVGTRARHELKLKEYSARRNVVQVSNSKADLEVRLLECLKTINKSNPRHARVLNLHYQGYSVGEICGRLNLSRTNLYSILSRARSMLWACLEERESK